MNRLAASQLAELAAGSDGAIDVLETTLGEGSTTFTVSLDTRGITTSGGGIRVRARERFEIVVKDSFPFKHPSVAVHHTRWAGTPHVQWGKTLCLYAAPSVEWNPADGMRGLIARLNLWLQRAATGTLDPDGQPLHPPVAYSSSEAGRIIIHPDLDHRVPWDDDVIPGKMVHRFAWCRRHGKRVDVHEWLMPIDAYERVLAEDFDAMDENDRPYFVAPVLLISDELGMEYPGDAAGLVTSLAGSAVSRNELLRILTSAGAMNRLIGSLAGADQEAPTVLLLGTPARRVEGNRRLAHLVAWGLDEFGSEITSLLGQVQRDASPELQDGVRDLAERWLASAKVSWMVVYESRPEITRRRDAGSAATWLMGKRVLLLGCGALGAPIAEHCVRAGVEGLTVVDNGVVSPGILVRQPYADADIGYSKARRLAARLNRIRTDLTVEYVHGDVVTRFFGAKADVPRFDLVVDATADIGVRTALETVRAPMRGQWPPLVTAIFGYESTRAIVTVSRSGATGAGHDLLRRVAIDARGVAANVWSDIADDFFPDPPRARMFFPEPGCSAPTFTGSSIQVTALASSLFWAAIRELSTENADRPMVAIAMRLSGTEPGLGTVSELTWPNDVTAIEIEDMSEVRISRRAIAEMRAEVRRGARVRGQSIETGGMLLGSFDDATGTVYIDVATGPSPDSALSAEYFGHGVEGTQDVIDHHRAATANRIGFTGMWHTHPFGRARPSPTDESGMASLVAPDGTGVRALMLILGGPSRTWNAWHDNGCVPDLYTRIVHRRRSTAGEAGVAAQVAPAGIYFPGGYGLPAFPDTDVNDHHWWDLFGRRS